MNGSLGLTVGSSFDDERSAVIQVQGFSKDSNDNIFISYRCRDEKEVQEEVDRLKKELDNIAKYSKRFFGR